MDIYPACVEDNVLALVRGGHWQCIGGDTVTLTTHTQDCEYLIGAGDYSGGYWDAYVCAMPASPDTAMLTPHGAGAPLAPIGAAILLVALVLAFLTRSR